MKVLFNVLVLLVVVSLGAHAGEVLDKAKAAYQQAEKQHTTVYLGLKKSLKDWQFKMLQTEQREWIEYRDHNVSLPEGASEEESLDYYQGMTAMVETRIKVLNEWKKDRYTKQDEPWTGYYTNNAGADLKIVEKGGKVKFLLTSFGYAGNDHDEISGEFQVNGRMARYSLNDNGDLLWINLDRLSDPMGRITLVVEGFLGRVSFDGVYSRTGSLSSDDLKAVEAGTGVIPDEE
ncbi:Protein of unknown function [Rubritalea squalenifaciens DSM 18772]|uniref:Lysozyme inhibitor LprI-like N-terminal domain-containing protein n=1 Tax=Rubritalea squalenifaciens DSM 18772 TaxID=1123071 RepID=A0A1M6SAH7_9BACT|nr:lysozyme inhibitor LprI family protein [Rubritalea squalenifaciens]SHK41629.1 Protein of unknown function [Rubritalea squalenifaciens DSM 18772]